MQKRKDEIIEVCQRFHVSRLEIFGSAARGTDFNLETSDVDFLVMYHPISYESPFDHFRLARELRNLLGRKVDLVEPGGIRNNLLLKEINKSRETIYEA